MLRHILATASLTLAAQLAHAAEAGKIIFVAGQAQVAEQTAQLGAAVQEGDLLSTGASGYVYIKTADNGLFILRPNTKARIAAYHVDKKNPANTRIKLELLSGVARSQSGEAVKLARQNFRFNTPVAAIGVRGTDFTVFTDQNTSRVAVISGGITVSGFGGACSPEGSGPCEGALARELSASQRGQLLQIQRGQSAPQLMQGGTLAPDMVAPPRGDEPHGKPVGASAVNPLGGAEPSLDPKKNASLQSQVPTTPSVVPPPILETRPEVKPPLEDTAAVVPPPVVPEVPPVVVIVPPREVSWGRWQKVLDQSATDGLSRVGADRLASNDYFVLFRSKEGTEYKAPERGSVAFNMAGSEAYVRDQTTQATSVATLHNGQLAVDFGTATFNTSFDVQSASGSIKLQSQGTLTGDGLMFGNNLGAGTNMTVKGAMGSDSDATYLFQGRLDSKRIVSGITFWGK